jgi:hypothetical protein
MDNTSTAVESAMRLADKQGFGLVQDSKVNNLIFYDDEITVVFTILKSICNFILWLPYNRNYSCEMFK